MSGIIATEIEEVHSFQQLVSYFHVLYKSILYKCQFYRSGGQDVRQI